MNVEATLAHLTEKIDALTVLVQQQRTHFSKADRIRYFSLIRSDYGGCCPICDSRMFRILGEGRWVAELDENERWVASTDHFRGAQNSNSSAGWSVCRSCNSMLERHDEHGRPNRDRFRVVFESFHERLARKERRAAAESQEEVRWEELLR